MDREQRVCPVCGQPVQSVVRRHKTLGVWVPRWVAGPCHNPDCDTYADGADEAGGAAESDGAGAAGQGAPETPVRPTG